MSRSLARLLALGALCWLLPFTGAHAGIEEDERTATIRAEVEQTGVHVDQAQAQGHHDLWQERLEAAVAASDLPVKVALWSEVEGLGPDLADATAGKLGDDERPVIWIVSDNRGPQIMVLGEQGTQRKQLRERAESLQASTLAVADGLRPTLGDGDRAHRARLIPVAHAWIWLRLSSPDAPSVADLVTELEPEASTLLGRRGQAPPATPRRDDDYFTPALWGTALVVVLLGVAVVVRLGVVEARARRATAKGTLVVPAWADEVTPLSVSRELTHLAEAIAAAPAQPGDPAYDGAQACSDAAEAHEGSRRVRDLVGMHLLAADGHRLLAGREVVARCYFNPGHVARTHVTRDAQQVPCCRACANDVRAGRRPDLLVLPDDSGRPVAYDEVDDVWTRTGYGSLNRLWARAVLLAALEDR